MRRAYLFLLATLSLAGCSRGFFTADGTLASVGPNRIDNWIWEPQGCIRGPSNRTDSALALLWEDPGARDPALSNHNDSPDAPLRLSFSHSEPVTAILETRYHNGILLDATACTVLRLHTLEHAAASPELRPSLSGGLELDCRAHGNHIAGQVTFERCQY